MIYVSILFVLSFTNTLVLCRKKLNNKYHAFRTINVPFISNILNFYFSIIWQIVFYIFLICNWHKMENFMSIWFSRHNVTHQFSSQDLFLHLFNFPLLFTSTQLSRILLFSILRNSASEQINFLFDKVAETWQFI